MKPHSLLVLIAIFVSAASLCAEDVWDDSRVVEKLSATHRKGQTVEPGSFAGQMVKFKMKLLKIERKQLAGVDCAVITGEIRKFSQPKARAITDKYHIIVTLTTADEELAKRPLGRIYTVEGIISEVTFFPEKLADPDNINSSHIVIYDKQCVELAQQEKVKTETRQRLQERMKGKICAVVVTGAVATIYGMEISGVVLVPNGIKASGITVKFGIYMGDIQTGTATDAIFDFVGEAWMFSAEAVTTKNAGNSYRFHSLLINHQQVPQDKILYMTREEYMKNYGDN